MPKTAWPATYRPSGRPVERPGSLLLRRTGGAAAAFSPASLFAASEAGAWYDPSDLSTMFQDSAGTTAAVVGQPVGRINDKSGRGNHATQATTSAKPILRQSGSLYYLEFDGVDDTLVVPSMAALGTSSVAVTALQTTDTSWIYMSRASNDPYIGVFINGGGAGTQSVIVDAYSVNRNVLISPTRDTLHDAISSASSKVLTVTGIDFGLFTSITLFNHTTLVMAGKWYGMVIHDGLTGPKISDTEGYLATKSGAVL